MQRPAAEGPPSSRAPRPTRQFVLELARQADIADPFAMPDRPQKYVRRMDGGGYQTSALRWSPKLSRQLDAARVGAEAEVRQQLGRTLRAFLDGFGWSTIEARIEAALGRGERVVITLRSAAAELWRLPWSLTAFGAAEGHLGAQPGVLIRMAWPESHTTPLPQTNLGPERILVAWAAPKRPVPWGPHVEAITAAARAGALPFDPEADVLANASPASLVARLEAARPERPIAALHLLAHGGAAGESFGLSLHSGDSEVVVDPGQLRSLLAPFADRVRLVVISACDGGNAGPLDGTLGSVAQTLHRAGFAAVVASQRPLSGRGSVVFTERFYRALLVEPDSVELAFVKARQALMTEAETADWAGLQLWSRDADGVDTRPITFRPYRGLLPFEAEHARFFFGRDPQRTEVIDDLRGLIAAGRPQLLVIAAASGTGKSSLARAAVLPDLCREAPGTRVAIMKPGVAPLAALDEATARWASGDGGPRLLLVDQLEEIFTLARPDEAERFCQRLWAMAGAAPDPVRILVTIRVDFIGRCGEITVEPGLNLDAVCYDEAHRIFVPRMSPADLRAAIEGPAERVGLALAPSLADRMLEDVGAEPGSLPLLQYALDQLWQRRQGRALTHAAYEAIGGVSGALTRHADAVVDALADAARDEARRLLVELVSLGEDRSHATRRRVDIEQIRPAAPEQAVALERAAEALVDARMVFRARDDGHDTLEIAHEALIRKWGRLADWVEADREKLLRTRDIVQIARDHQTHGSLMRGNQLGHALAIAEQYPGALPADAVSLIDRSQAAARAAVRQRWVLQGLLFASIAIVAVVMAFLLTKAKRAEWNAKGAEEAANRDARAAQLSRDRADASRQKAEAVTLKALARQFLGQPHIAATILRESGEQQSPTFVATAHQLLGAPIPSAAFDLSEVGGPIATAISPDGRQLAASGTAGRVALWWTDGRSSAPLAELEAPSEHEITHLVFSPDGAHLASGSSNGGVHLWRIRGRGQPTSLLDVMHGAAVTALAFSPDGVWLVTGGADSVTRLWRTDGSDRDNPITLDGPGGAVSSLSVSGSGDPLVVNHVAGGARIWPGPSALADDARPRPRATVDTVGRRPARSALLSPDNATLAALDEAGDVELRRWPSRGRRGVRTIKGQQIDWMTFSPDGAALLAVSRAGRATRWRVADGQRLSALALGDARIDAVRFDAAGERFAVVPSAGPVRVWPWSGASRPLALRGHVAALVGAAFSPTGAFVATSSEDSAVLIWPLDGTPPVGVLPVGPTGEPPAEGLGSPSVIVPADGQPLVAAVAVHPQRPTGHVWRYDPRTGTAAPTRDPIADVTAVALDPSGRRVATGHLDGVPRVWSTSDSEAAPIEPRATDAFLPRSTIEVIAFDRAGRAVVTGHIDGAVRVWRVDAPGRQAVHVGQHAGAVQTAAFGPDGRFVLTGSADGKARLWSVTRPKEQALIEMSHSVGIHAVTINTDGSLIATGGDAVRIWRRREGAVEQGDVFQGVPGFVRSVTFSPDGGSMLVGFRGGAALWRTDGSDRSEPIRFPAIQRAYAGAFSPDGSRVAIVDARGYVLVRSVDPAPLDGALWHRTAYCLGDRSAALYSRQTVLGENDLVARQGEQRCRCTVDLLRGAQQRGDCPEEPTVDEPAEPLFDIRQQRLSALEAKGKQLRELAGELHKATRILERQLEALRAAEE